MRLTILAADGSKLELSNVYSIGICFGRIYIHSMIKERGMDTVIESINYPLNEIVDILIDLPVNLNL